MIRIVDGLLMKCSELAARFRLRAHGVNPQTKPGEWSIGYDDAVAIVSELDRFVQHGKIDVLEMGAGFSTLLLLDALEAKFGRSFRMVSVEADQRTYDEVAPAAEKLAAASGGAFVLLKAEYVSAVEEQTFDWDGVWPQTGFGRCDLILVDAPPDTHGENVRLNLCRKLIPCLKPKGVLLLHDTKRIDELYAGVRLQDHFHETERLDTRKGLTIFRFPRESA